MPNFVKISNENFDELTYLVNESAYHLDHTTQYFEDAYNRLNQSAANIFGHLGSSKTILDRKKIWIDKFHSTFSRNTHEILNRAAIYDSTHLGLVMLEVENNTEIIEIVQEDQSVTKLSVGKHDMVIIPHAVTRSWPKLNGNFVILNFEIVV